MADLSAVYTLTTADGTIAFNDGDLKTTDDLYWIQNLRGFDSPSLRTPLDDAPQDDGAIVHDFWKGARHLGFEGVLLVQSVPFGGDCTEQLNVMEEALAAALESILREDGQLSWTPAGSVLHWTYVRYEVGLEITPSDNYATRTFTFGLVTGEPDFYYTS